MNKELEIVNHPPINLQQAMFIVDEYFKRLKPRYEWGEEALSASMFGFQKSEGEFIEISIISPGEILLKHETSAPKKIFFANLEAISQKEKKLTSVDATKQVVAQFFKMDGNEFRATL
jgi:hypothetical protein